MFAVEKNGSLLPGTVTIIYNAQLANMDQHDMNVIKFKRDLSDVDIKKINIGRGFPTQLSNAEVVILCDAISDNINDNLRLSFSGQICHRTEPMVGAILDGLRGRMNENISLRLDFQSIHSETSWVHHLSMFMDNSPTLRYMDIGYVEIFDDRLKQSIINHRGLVQLDWGHSQAEDTNHEQLYQDEADIMNQGSIHCFAVRYEHMDELPECITDALSRNNGPWSFDIILHESIIPQRIINQIKHIVLNQTSLNGIVTSNHDLFHIAPNCHIVNNKLLKSALHINAHEESKKCKIKRKLFLSPAILNEFIAHLGRIHNDDEMDRRLSYTRFQFMGLLAQNNDGVTSESLGCMMEIVRQHFTQ